MALVISRSSSAQKPWMLKDYLLDDLGSCSSTGFRSFPRHHCCAAVCSRSSASRRLLSKSSSSSSASSKISHAIHRASKAVISAVKLLPFKSPAPEKAKKKKTLLPRSLSRRLFKRSLWKKVDDGSRDCEIERWISSGAVAATKKYQPSDLSNETTVSSTTITITITSPSTRSSTNSDSWSESDSEFTLLHPSLDENGVVEGKPSSSAVTVGDESIETARTKKKWINEGEKEHLSPVSVFDFPDDQDEQIGSSSPFTLRLNHLEGNKEKLMHKLRRFECLSRLDPTNLEVQLSLAKVAEDESPKFFFQSSPSPPHTTSTALNKEEELAERLLELTKVKMAVSGESKFDVDRLLINFFEDGLVKGEGKKLELVEEELLSEAEDWLIGRCHNEVSVAWKVKEKREVYAKEMEVGGAWRSNSVEKKEVVAEVENEVLGYLVDEVVGEFGLF